MFFRRRVSLDRGRRTSSTTAALDSDHGGLEWRSSAEVFTVDRRLLEHVVRLVRQRCRWLCSTQRARVVTGRRVRPQSLRRSPKRMRSRSSRRIEQRASGSKWWARRHSRGPRCCSARNGRGRSRRGDHRRRSDHRKFDASPRRSHLCASLECSLIVADRVRSIGIAQAGR